VSSGNGYCFCALAKCLSPWRKKHHVENDYSRCVAKLFNGPVLLQHCCDKGDDYHTAAAFYLTTLFKNGTGLTQAALHHGTIDQSRMTNEGNSGCYFQDIDSQEPNHPYQVNESILDNAGDTVGKGTSTLSGQEIPSQCTKDNDGCNLVDKATDMNGDPSKDSEHTDDVENLTVDEPDGIFDNVEVNTVAEGNDTYGHPSQESVVIVHTENSVIDGLDIIHDSSKTIDINVEQTETIVDFDGDCNDVSQKELPVQSVHESGEINTFDKANDVNGDPNKDLDHTNVAENMAVDDSNIIFDSVELNTVAEEKYVHDVCV
jgi:hypothetical protein